MDEHIKPVAWRTKTRHGWVMGNAQHGSEYEPLYSQQCIDALRAEVEGLRAACDKWSERELLFGAHEDLQARAERAEAEAEALRSLCRDMLAVFEAARPLVLNLERLRDAARKGAE